MDENKNKFRQILSEDGACLYLILLLPACLVSCNLLATLVRTAKKYFVPGTRFLEKQNVRTICKSLH